MWHDDGFTWARLNLQKWDFSVCGICYEYPAYLPGYCPACPPPPPCPECSIMTMTTPYHPRPPRPSTLPGLQSFDERRGRHDSPGYAPLPPTLTTPVHMHPDPQNITNNTGSLILFYFIFYLIIYCLYFLHIRIYSGVVKNVSLIHCNLYQQHTHVLVD